MFLKGTFVFFTVVSGFMVVGSSQDAQESEDENILQLIRDLMLNDTLKNLAGADDRPPVPDRELQESASRPRPPVPDRELQESAPRSGPPVPDRELQEQELRSIQQLNDAQESEDEDILLEGEDIRQLIRDLVLNDLLKNMAGGALQGSENLRSRGQLLDILLLLLIQIQESAPRPRPPEIAQRPRPPVPAREQQEQELRSSRQLNESNEERQGHLKVLIQKIKDKSRRKS